MSYIRVSCFTLVSLFLATTAGALSIAKEPTAGELVAGIPVLQTKDDNLKAFQFSFEIGLSKTPIYGQCVWTKATDFAIVASAGDDRTPFLLLSEHKCVIVDLVQRSAFISKSSWPTASFSATNLRVDANVGLGSENKGEFAIDLKSFLQFITDSGKLERDKEGNWRLTCLSLSGNSKTVTVFDDTPQHSIQSFEFSDVKSDRVMFAFREIAFNDKTNWVSPAFPKDDVWPSGLTLIRDVDKNDTTKPTADADVDKDRAKFFQLAIFFQSAIRDIDSRNALGLKKIDWNEVSNTVTEMGPVLRKLITKLGPDPMVLPKQ